MLITKRSDLSGKFHTIDIPITEAQYNNWVVQARYEAPIQVVFPMLTDAQREFLLTGITDEEWNETFKDVEDDDDFDNDEEPF